MNSNLTFLFTFWFTLWFTYWFTFLGRAVAMDQNSFWFTLKLVYFSREGSTFIKIFVGLLFNGWFTYRLLTDY